MKPWAYLALMASLTALAGDNAQQAKELMTQGKRVLAVQKLDLAASQTRNKREIKELARKKLLYLEQFVTSDSFQKYQDALGLQDAGRLDDASSELDSISEKDQDNLLVMRLKGEVYFALRKYDQSLKMMSAVRTFLPDDARASLLAAEIHLSQKKVKEAMVVLDGISAEILADKGEYRERFAITKAHALEASDEAGEAIEVLKKDQEENLDHVLSIYELGMLYSRSVGYDWQSRKMLTLFLSRSKRMTDADKKRLGLIDQLRVAQETLDKLNKKLGI